MIKSRLLTLARHLEKIGKKPPRRRRFNLTGWFNKRDCGTVCCAVGEATYIPELKKLGLLIEGSSPRYKDDYDWCAAQTFFGLSYGEALRLFSYASYESGANTIPAEVASRIRDFVTEANRSVEQGRK